MSAGKALAPYPPALRWKIVIAAHSVFGSDRAVLLALAYHAHQGTLQAWPSRAALAREAGVSEDTVDRSLARLEAVGAVTVLERSSGGAKRVNRYRVNLDTAETWGSNTPPEPPHGAAVNSRKVRGLPGENSRKVRKKQPHGAEKTAARCGRNRGIEQGIEQIDVSITEAADDHFTEFWSRYPRKQGKQAARKAWEKLKPDDALIEGIMTGLRRWIDSPDWRKDEGRFVPHPATWLNGHRWEDEIGVNFEKEARREAVADYDY